MRVPLRDVKDSAVGGRGFHLKRPIDATAVGVPALTPDREFVWSRLIGAKVLPIGTIINDIRACVLNESIVGWRYNAMVDAGLPVSGRTLPDEVWSDEDPREARRAGKVGDAG
jgi:hypothetical protein